MAKKKTSEDEKEQPTALNIDPCWSRFDNRAASGCYVSINIGGWTLHTYAEFTEKEEREAKDLASLKRTRIKDAFLELEAHAMEYLNG